MAKVDDAGEGLVVKITENISDDTILDACKVPPTLEVGVNPSAESSPSSENYGS